MENPKHIKSLIDKLASVTGYMARDRSSFGSMAKKIPPGKEDLTNVKVSQQYLYRTYRKACRLIESKETQMDVSLSRLTLIAQAIGKSSFQEFVEEIEQKIDPQLKLYAGNWWSIVRANYDAVILKAPVRIFEDKERNEMRIEMKGGRKTFYGRVELRVQNMFCSLDTGTDKILYIVMKTGMLESPQLLEGVFAGISTLTEPIAGREIFRREPHKSFDEMVWSNTPVADARKSGVIEKEILDYLDDPSRRGIKINQDSDRALVGLVGKPMKVDAV